MMARAITSDELGYLRSNNQFCELSLAIQQPTSYWTGQVNQAFTSGSAGVYDSISELAIDGSSGAGYAGMTVYAGSSAGAYDKGYTRLRQDTSGDTLYIAETSDIEWEDDDYLTVVDDFNLWAKHATQIGDATYMDYDTAYSDQHADFYPVPVLGHDPVMWLTSGSAAWSPDASASWCPDDTIASYQWSAVGTSASSAMDTATPTMSWGAAGQYWVKCAVTSAGGKSSTGHRRVYVYDDAHPPVTQFSLDRCEGDAPGGGWQFGVTMYAEAARATVRDRARCILFAKDIYAGTERLIGPYADGTQNIVCSGWIDGESIEWNPIYGTVSFTVQGPAFWLNKLSSFPAKLSNVSAAPADWDEIQGLTIDKAIHHLLTWRSTATNVIDVILSGDTRQAEVLDAAAGTLWDQIVTIAGQSILAQPICDRYGRMYVEIDTQYLAAADRASIPIVMAVTTDDWHDSITLERSATSKTSVVDVSGSYFDGTNVNPMMARAPGHVYKPHGDILSVDRLIFTDQDNANTLAGAILSLENNEYPSIDIDPLAMNNRMIDICPRQYITLTLAAGDTPRGVAFTAKKFIPRNVSFKQSDRSGALLTSITVEAETLPGIAVMIIPPQPPEDNTTEEPETPTWESTTQPSYTPPTTISPTPSPTLPECVTDAAYATTGPHQIYGLAGVYNSSTFRTRTTPYKGYIRPSSHTHKTKWALRGVFEQYDIATSTWKPYTPTSTMFTVQALKGGAVVATGVPDAILLQYYQTGGFGNGAAVEFDALRVTFAGGSFTEIINSGTETLSRLSYNNAAKKVSDTLLDEQSTGYWRRGTVNSIFDAGKFSIYGEITYMGVAFHRLPDGLVWPSPSSWHIYGTALWGPNNDQYDIAGPWLGAGDPAPAWTITRYGGGTAITGAGVSFDQLVTISGSTDTIQVQFSAGQGPHDPAIRRTFQAIVTLENGDAVTRRFVLQQFQLWNICTV